MRINYRVREIQVGGWVTGKDWSSNRSGATQAYRVARIEKNIVTLLINNIPRPDMEYDIKDLRAVPPHRKDTIYYE